MHRQQRRMPGRRLIRVASSETRNKSVVGHGKRITDKGELVDEGAVGLRCSAEETRKL